MQSSLLTKDFKSSQGHKEHIKSFYDKGGLDFLSQRLDIGVIEGDKDKPHRFKLKVGKTQRDGKEFINHKNKDNSLEVPQEFRTAFPDMVNEYWKEMIRSEIRLRSLREEFNMPEARKRLMYKMVNDVMDIFKEDK